MHDIIGTILAISAKTGYFGVFFGMMLESTIFPVPSELILIPAGYLAQQGRLSVTLLIAAGGLGSVAGALINYYFAQKFGLPFLKKYGRYFLVSARKLDSATHFFQNHGEVSTFIGRLIPFVRHFISIPAGIARMDVKKFCAFTFFGSSLWSACLVLLGYIIGSNTQLLKQYQGYIYILVVVFCLIVVAGYVLIKRARGELGAF